MVGHVLAVGEVEARDRHLGEGGYAAEAECETFLRGLGRFAHRLRDHQIGRRIEAGGRRGLRGGQDGFDFRKVAVILRKECRSGVDGGIDEVGRCVGRKRYREAGLAFGEGAACRCGVCDAFVRFLQHFDRIVLGPRDFVVVADDGPRAGLIGGDAERYFAGFGCGILCGVLRAATRECHRNCCDAHR